MSANNIDILNLNLLLFLIFFLKFRKLLETLCLEDLLPYSDVGTSYNLCKVYFLNRVLPDMRKVADAQMLSVETFEY